MLIVLIIWFTAVPQIWTKKGWLEVLALPQGRDEKEKPQANALKFQHPEADLQLYSTAPGSEATAP